MRVYRCITTREITNLYKSNKKYQTTICALNTYQFNFEKDYIHFFRFYESALYYKKRNDSSKNPWDHCVLMMTANIPHSLLKESLGYGFYSGVDKRLTCYITPIPEYHIDTTLFKNDYIVEVSDKVNPMYRNKRSEYDDYIMLMNELGDRYNGDYSKAVLFLQSHNLDELLQIEEDNRSEEKIRHDELKQLVKSLRK